MQLTFIKRAKTLWCSALLMLPLLLSSGICLSEPSTTSVFFYNPETNVHRNSILKQKLDRFLVTKGNYQFQPVNDRTAFKQLTQNQSNALFIMSSWMFESLAKDARLSPKLVGIKNDSAFFKKSLVIHKQFQSKPLNELVIASAGSDLYGQTVLSNIYKHASNNQQAFFKTPTSIADALNFSPKLLTVPKDLDALLSVGFGMAQGALSTKESLNQLKTLYQNQHQQLVVLGESTPVMRIVVATPEEASPQILQLIPVLEDMKESVAGKISLSLMGLDSWIPFNKAIKEKHDIATGLSLGGEKP